MVYLNARCDPNQMIYSPLTSDSDKIQRSQVASLLRRRPRVRKSASNLSTACVSVLTDTRTLLETPYGISHLCRALQRSSCGCLPTSLKRSTLNDAARRGSDTPHQSASSSVDGQREQPSQSSIVDSKSPVLDIQRGAQDGSISSRGWKLYISVIRRRVSARYSFARSYSNITLRWHSPKKVEEAQPAA